jgi:hypothetical protein
MRLDGEAVIPFVPTTLDEIEGVADIIEAFLVVMRRLPTSEEQERAFEQLERVRQRFLTEGKRALLLDDILTLDAALLLFLTLLSLKVAPSTKREIVIESLWQMRSHLSVLRSDNAPGFN